MEKCILFECFNWCVEVEELGFIFVDMGGEFYWDEISVYVFILCQIEEDLEDLVVELYVMCCEVVDCIICDEELMQWMDIFCMYWDFVVVSWSWGEFEFYGCMDLFYDGKGLVKLLEYNVDILILFYEFVLFQWLWFEQQQVVGVLGVDCDQFNGLYEVLVDCFGQICIFVEEVYFVVDVQNFEDYVIVEVLVWVVCEVGLGVYFIDLVQIGLIEEGQFVDDQFCVIGMLFKFYLWEDMLCDEFVVYL